MRIEERYCIETKIGEGAQSVVFSARCRQSGLAVAVKHIKPTPNHTGRDRIVPISKLGANFREIAILQRLRSTGQMHANIVDLIEVIFDEHSVYIVMNHCGINLSEYIARCRSCDVLFRPAGTSRTSRPTSPMVSVHLIQSIMRQVISAMTFVHSQFILHRDLKPQNIFVQFADDQVIVKVGDFGLSKALTVPIPPETLNVASLWYRAPEVLLQSGYDVGIDLWSLGCILVELGQGSPLFLDSCEFGLLMKIFQTLGTPSKDVWGALGRSPNASIKWPQWNREKCLTRFRSYVTNLLGASGCELVLAFLKYESNERIRCQEALVHPFLRLGPDSDDGDDIGDLSDRLSDLNV